MSKYHQTVFKFVCVSLLIGLLLVINSITAAQGVGKGDLNQDGQINWADVELVRANFRQNNPAADVNQDGLVNIQDLTIIGSHFNETVEEVASENSAPRLIYLPLMVK